MKKTIVLTTCLATTLMLSGCASMQLAVSKRHLDVQTKTSATVFLDPVPDAQKTIFVQIKNTSDQPNVHLKPEVVAQLEQKGYHVTNHLNRAHYLLQANVLKIGKTSQSAAEKALGGGYGSALSGAVAGAAAAATMSNSGAGVLAGGIIGGTLSTITDSLVKDVVYSAITDVQISERVHGNIQERNKSALSQGTGGRVIQTSRSKTHWRRYRTRIVSTAEKANLKFAQAIPKLRVGLSHALSGFF